MALHLLDVGHCGVDDGPYVLDILLDVVLDGRKDLCLGHVDKVVHIYGIIVRLLEDIIRGGDEVALYGLLLEYLDIILDMGRRTYFLGEAGQGDGAAHGFQLAL